MSDERPWEDYSDPLAPPQQPGSPSAAPVSGEPDVGYVEDVGKGIAGGLGRGVAGTLGLPGTIGNATRAGLNYLGVPEKAINAGASAVRAAGYALPPLRAFSGPDASQVQSAMEGVTGKFYEPKTVPGQYASTLAEFAPGALIPGGAAARAVNTVVPAIASETAGQITKGTAAEPWARGAAGLISGPAAAKAITPARPASAAHQNAVRILENEGIPLSAGKRTGSKPIQWAESTAADMPGSAGRAAQLQEAERAAFDRAVTNRLYDRNQLTARGVPEDVNLPDVRVARAGPQSLSDEYTRLTSQNQLRSSLPFENRMRRAQDEYERLVLPHEQTPNVRQTRDDIILRLLGSRNWNRMPGDEYQSIRSQIGKSAKNATNTQEAAALREIRNAMDEAMQAGLSPADARAWALNNRRYANMKQIEPAVAGASEHLSPARVAQTARTGRGAQYSAQRGDLDELAKAASTVMKELPQSGTAPRTAWQSMFNLPTILSAGGGGVLGSALGPAGAIIGAAMPFGAARAVLSGPGQRYLGNRALPQRGRDVVAQTLAQQAISQPSGIARNEEEREEYEKKRKDPLRLTVHPSYR